MPPTKENEMKQLDDPQYRIEHQELAKEAAQWLKPASIAYEKSRGWLRIFIANRKADNTPKLTINNCILCEKETRTNYSAGHVLCASCWVDMHGDDRE